MLANPCIGAPRHRLLTGHPSQHSSGTRVPPRCSKRHRGQWVVSGELTRFSQAPQYRPASPTDRLLKRMETGRGGCCNPSPASVSDQVHQTSYPYEEAFKQDTGGTPQSCDSDTCRLAPRGRSASRDPRRSSHPARGSRRSEIHTRPKPPAIPGRYARPDAPEQGDNGSHRLCRCGSR